MLQSVIQWVLLNPQYSHDLMGVLYISSTANPTSPRSQHGLLYSQLHHESTKIELYIGATSLLINFILQVC